MNITSKLAWVAFSITCIDCAHGLPAGGGGGNTCYRADCPPPPPAQATAAVYSMDPNFGWTGDRIRLQGRHLVENPSVTINGVTAAIISTNAGVQTRSFDIVDVLVPTLATQIVGPFQVPVTITNSFGTVTTLYTASPTLAVGGTVEFPNAIGRAGSSIRIDRNSGFMQGQIQVSNLSATNSLTVSAAAVFFDDAGKAIAFSAPHTTTAKGVLFNWPSSDSVVNETWSETAQAGPSVTVRIRTGMMVLVKDDAQGLFDTLSQAVALGKTIKEVADAIIAIAAF